MERLASAIGTEQRKDSVGDVDSELVRLFGKSGEEALLEEFSSRFDVSISDAIRRPGAFHTALQYTLGELVASFVMDQIDLRVSGVAQTAPK